MTQSSTQVNEKNQPLTVFIISDSSGETAEGVARAALVQFPAGTTSIYRLPQVRSTENIKTFVRTAAAAKGLIAYTLVLPEYRETLVAETEKLKIPTVDVLGPLISRVSALTSTIPLSQPGRLHQLDETYFRRIEAVDFAIRFDDGKHPEGVLQADVVLLGVSRTSKTPNSIYLAHHYGLKSANIPIILKVEPPNILFKIPVNKIVGLTIEPHLLQEIRSTRTQVLGMSSANEYSDLEQVTQEVRYAKKLFRELKCHVIDVSAKAIEETSSEIYLFLRQ
ncbi:MAG: phosphoenolpyruvate synthase regulatory protein [Candidatus Melainabacteria bacterium]|nr:MAG: phosphoenolpyruvate synthase regulatory protein [Candidatus Melainabacteria bacterium]